MASTRSYHREYSRNYYHLRRDRFIGMLGGKCVKCGSTDNLEFHHIDKNLKSYNIGKFMLSFPESILLKELAKCTLLCKNCHKEISDNDKRNVKHERYYSDFMKISGENSHLSTITAEKAFQIYNQYHIFNLKVYEIVKLFSVKRGLVRSIVECKTWVDTITNMEYSFGDEDIITPFSEQENGYVYPSESFSM